MRKENTHLFYCLVRFCLAQSMRILIFTNKYDIKSFYILNHSRCDKWHFHEVCMNAPHTPVLLNEVLQFVSPSSGAVYVDGTFGAGGYSKALLETADCIIHAIDQDSSVQKYAEELSIRFSQRLQFHINKFSKMNEILSGQTFDGIVLDLGVSSMQLEEAERGFSFMQDGPLDMRMSKKQSINAATIVNAFREEELANIIYKYSNERYAKRIASAITKYRETKIIETTKELADIVRSIVPRSKVEKIDPATRTFQALRIWVNDELSEIEKAIDSATELLKIGGRLVIVSFHSLEDKIVKEKFNHLCGKHAQPSRHIPSKNTNIRPTFTTLHKKIITPSTEEVEFNPRARSARLRAIEKIR